MNNYQVQYLNLTQEDKIELTNPKNQVEIYLIRLPAGSTKSRNT